MSITRIDWQKAGLLLLAITLGGGGGTFLYFHDADAGGADPRGAAAPAIAGGGGGSAVELAALRSEVASWKATAQRNAAEVERVKHAAAVIGLGGVTPTAAEPVAAPQPCVMSYSDAVADSYLPGCAESVSTHTQPGTVFPVVDPC